MSQLLEYDPELTREILRAIVKHDNHKLQSMRRAIWKVGGALGNPKFEDVTINDGRMFCESNRIRSANYGDRTAEEIDTDPAMAWEADGVWVPTAEVK